MTADESLKLPAPDTSELSRPFWQALEGGMLTFQRCASCGHAWLPARSECPNCLGDSWSREPASGKATLVSWVVYRHAYHPAFAPRLPYTVAIVRLDEGPQLISNITGTDAAALRIEQPLRLTVEREDGIAVPRFSPA